MTMKTWILPALFAVGCAGKLPPPSDPLRPPAEKLAATQGTGQGVGKVVNGVMEQSANDCPPTAPNEGPPAKPYSERSEREAEDYATQGLKMLVQAEDQSRPVGEVTDLIEKSVQKFHVALAADPLNVKATYNLAAAYARIGRNQCAVNLLARLSAMKNFPSRKKNSPVAGAFGISQCGDVLLGRNGKKPDPDFDTLRADPKFREAVKGLQ